VHGHRIIHNNEKDFQLSLSASYSISYFLTVDPNSIIVPIFVLSQRLERLLLLNSYSVSIPTNAILLV